jgi:hypothetical protein
MFRPSDFNWTHQISLLASLIRRIERRHAAPSLSSPGSVRSRCPKRRRAAPQPRTPDAVPHTQFAPARSRRRPVLPAPHAPARSRPAPTLCAWFFLYFARPAQGGQPLRVFGTEFDDGTVLAALYGVTVIAMLFIGSVLVGRWSLRTGRCGPRMTSSLRSRRLPGRPRGRQYHGRRTHPAHLHPYWLISAMLVLGTLERYKKNSGLFMYLLASDFSL